MLENIPSTLKPGTVIGRLTLVEIAERGKRQRWVCKCECGTVIRHARSDKLRNGRLTSCGCYLREKNEKLHKERIERDGPDTTPEEKQARLDKIEQNHKAAEIRQGIAKRHREDVVNRRGGVSFELRHSHYLVKPRGGRSTFSLGTEGVPKDDLIWNPHFYAELIRDLTCHYCLGLIGKWGHGLDRMDNSKPHLASNVVPCCGFCNSLKGDKVSYEEMMLLIPGLREIRLRRDIYEANFG